MRMGLGDRGAPRPRRGAGLQTRARRSLLGLLVALGAALAWVDPVASQPVERPTSREAERAISVLRSPYCPGFMLEVCPSPQAQALRDSIYDLAGQGATSDEIVEWMIANHGEEWRGLPRRSGAGLLAWVIPPLAMLLAIGALTFWLRTSRGRGPAAASTETETLSAEERTKLAAALREWEETGHEEV